MRFCTASFVGYLSVSAVVLAAAVRAGGADDAEEDLERRGWICLRRGVFEGGFGTL